MEEMMNEAHVVGQGLGRSIEASLEWCADNARGEERFAEYML
jgi:hypothetical protein